MCLCQFYSKLLQAMMAGWSFRLLSLFRSGAYNCIYRTYCHGELMRLWVRFPRGASMKKYIYMHSLIVSRSG
ncbi:hypothetical protein J4Q44_G00118390 [Coregonus suidteri]|uniref:Uncharacterized protein n=1 Tax=Coregonus suidteri TaxID=861788 RepID=A0AAN8LWC3_9TELE